MAQISFSDLSQLKISHLISTDAGILLFTFRDAGLDVTLKTSLAVLVAAAGFFAGTGFAFGLFSQFCYQKRSNYL